MASKCSPQTVFEVITNLNDKVEAIYMSLLRLVLLGLEVPRHLVDSKNTFLALFDLLEKNKESLTAANITTHVLKRFGYKRPTGLEEFLDEGVVFDIGQYPGVNLRLTVAEFFYRLGRDDLNNAFLHISRSYLDNMAIDKMTSIADVTELLCARKIITINDIAPIQQIAQQYLPGHFDEYCKKHNLPTNVKEPGEIPVLDHQEKATVTSLKPKIVKVSDNVGNGLMLVDSVNSLDESKHKFILKYPAIRNVLVIMPSWSYCSCFNSI
jgi:hypothetical protein